MHCRHANVTGCRVVSLLLIINDRVRCDLAKFKFIVLIYVCIYMSAKTLRLLVRVFYERYSTRHKMWSRNLILTNRYNTHYLSRLLSLLNRVIAFFLACRKTRIESNLGRHLPDKYLLPSFCHVILPC